jgi:hypothetical protein
MQTGKCDLTGTKPSPTTYMHQFVENSSNCIDFAVFPYIGHPLREFVRGPVRLQVGNARWGLHHIVKAHSVWKVFTPSSPRLAENSQLVN